MSDFNLAIDALLRDEGDGYVEDDHGRGPSKWGITLKTAHELHPDWTAEDIRNLDRSAAITFYRDWAWDFYHFGLIWDQALASKAFNLAVNSGPSGVIKSLQEVAGVTQDGVLGPITAAALNQMNPQTALDHFKLAELKRYEQIEAAHPEWAADFAGWKARVLA